MNELWIVRHGETEWSASGRHTSTTDIPLTDAGLRAATALAPELAPHPFALVLTSPMRRARDSAAAAGFPDAIPDADLCEWNYGEFEGITTREIRARGGDFAQWTIFRGPTPGGETIEAVAARAKRVLERVATTDGAVLCFGHAHFSRVLTAVALDLGPSAAARFVLEPATVSVIGSERGQRALRLWNAGPPATTERA